MKRIVCTECQKPSNVCYCHTIQLIDNRWPVHILQHPIESRHPIGTARIAALSLQNCRLDIVTDFADIACTVPINSDALLVYPCDGAQPLEDFIQLQPRPLIFLDASWKKSRRMLYESAALQSLQKVRFNSVIISRYRIRKEPAPGYVSTLEAITHALSVLEGDREKFQPMMATMDYMIQRQIDHMGEEVFARNYSD